MIQLSPDQTVAVSALLTQLKQRKEAILVGAAGTGKTTTLEAFLAEWAKPENRPPGIGAEPVCVCPTWKAALRFTQVTGHESRSIHSLIYGAPDEKKGERGRRELVFDTLRDNPDVKNSLVVIDEASMVGEKTYSDLTAWAKTHRCLLLFVGDREQLEPVNSAWGVDFANPTAALTQVHRQADGSHLLDFVTRIREGTAHQFQAYGTDVNWHKACKNLCCSVFGRKRISSQTVSASLSRTSFGRGRIGWLAVRGVSRATLNRENPCLALPTGRAW